MLRVLAHALTGGASALSAGDAADGSTHARSRALVALLFNCYVLPALTTPEAYGMHVHGATISTSARQNLSALAVSLEQLVALVGLDGAAEQGSALENARRYFTPALLSVGPMTAYSAALALVDGPRPSMRAEAWPLPPIDGGGDLQLIEDDAAMPVLGANGGANGGNSGGGVGPPGSSAPGTPLSKAAGKQPVGSKRRTSKEAPAASTAITAGADATIGPGSGGVVVLEESCLLALLRFVSTHLSTELPLPPPLRSLIGIIKDAPSAANESSAAAPDQKGVLAKGSRAWYTRGGAKKLATVLNVHYDDDPPYYTVKIDDSERSTVRFYLAPLTALEDAVAGGGPASEGCEPIEVNIAKVGPLGITLENSVVGSPPRLTVLIPNGAAIRSGKLQIGDLFAKVRTYPHLPHLPHLPYLPPFRALCNLL